ncbi:MAG: GTP cyclohydrolase II [Rhodobacteraceae bacterium]|nr:GTP cyclohydrolase II [Paracoccaceae bacterium]
MPIILSTDEQIARMRGDLRMGVPVVITAGSQVWLAVAVETLTAERLQQMRDKNTALEIALTDRRAETLAAPAYDGDMVRIAVPSEATVGWLHAMADPSLDLQMPLKGPFSYLRDGTPAVHRAGLQLCKKAGLLPCMVLAAVKASATTDDLSRIGLQTLQQIDQSRSPLELVSNARVPLSVEENSRVHVFRRRDGGEEHYAIEIGRPARATPVLSRLHSACFTGDLIGSLKCDCGAQLRSAMAQIGEEGAGVLLYLNQEGRGIGLANKMRAYSLQDQGFDTVEANHRLGFEDDERDFMLGAEILLSMGFSSVRLMTNNPRKVKMMSEAGIEVAERVPLKVGKTPQNADYLATKAKKSGHLL